MLDARIVWLTQKVPSITRDGIVFTILGRKEAGSTDFGTRRHIVGGCVRCRRGMLEVTADLLQEPNLGSGANEANEASEASEANVASEASEQEKAISRGSDVFSLHPWHSACTCVAMIGSTPKWRPRVRLGGVVFLLVGHVCMYLGGWILDHFSVSLSLSRAGQKKKKKNLARRRKGRRRCLVCCNGPPFVLSPQIRLKIERTVVEPRHSRPTRVTSLVLLVSAGGWMSCR